MCAHCVQAVKTSAHRKTWSAHKYPFQKCFSFIHYGDLYSASSRLLLRSAPNPCTAKKKNFEAGVECVRKQFLHIFHTRRSKYRRVLVECCIKEILCAHRL